jgi:hypothetical protein
MKKYATLQGNKHEWVKNSLSDIYWHKGLPAVEAELLWMMEETK